MATIQSLLTQAAVIRDATAEGENTALRVGSMFVSLIQAIVATLPSELLDASGISYSAGESNFLITFNAVSSDGSTSKKQIIIPAASQGNAGLLTPAKLKELNDAVASVADCLTKVNQAASANAQTLSAHATAIANNAVAIEDLRADPHRHVVISLTKLNNWQDKELADALGFLWDYTQQHTLYINVGTVIVFHSPTEGWVSYQWRNQTGTDGEANVKNPANWERYTPKAEDLAKLEALPAKAEIDAAIEAASRKWFIEATAMYGVGYDAATGLFSLNGLTDITYPQMQVIWSEKGPNGPLGRFQHVDLKGRTNLPTHGSSYYSGCGYMFYRCLNIEIISIPGGVNSSYENEGYIRMFRDCVKLRKIIGGFITISNTTISLTEMFSNCPKLEYVEIRMLVRRDLDFADSPLLSLEMWQYLLKWANTDTSKQATITVHPEVYAKLSDESNAEWHKVMTDATALNIIFATTE